MEILVCDYKMSDEKLTIFGPTKQRCGKILFRENQDLRNYSFFSFAKTFFKKFNLRNFIVLKRFQS
jgi:hypothetical protein